MKQSIRELHRTLYSPLVSRDSSPYQEHGSFPWYKELAPKPTKEEAWSLAIRWARNYENADPLGNMANAMGVIQKDGGWSGVVNYFHSNT